MISYRATLTNRTGLGPKEGEVSAVHLHRDPVFSDWKVRFHSSPDRFTGQRSLGESTSGEFVDKSTSHLCSTGPGGLEQQSPDRLTGPLSTGRTGRDKSHRPHPRNRIGPDRTGCQSPDESTGHGTVELSTGQRTLDKSTGQLKLSSVQHGRIPMGQRSSTEQSTTIWYMGHSSGRGPTVTSRNRYSTGPDQTNSSDYWKIGYRTDDVPDRTGHRRSVVSRDRSKSTDHPSRLDGQGFRIPLRNSSPNNRSPSFSSPSRRSRRKHRSEKKKKRIRHSSSSGSSISSCSSSSRSRSRRHKKRHHRSRSVSRHHRHRHGRKRRRSPSSSSSERRSKKSYNERADEKSVSPVRQSLSPSPSRFTVAHEISLTVGSHDDDFQFPSKSNFKKPAPHITDSQFYSNVDPSDFRTRNYIKCCRLSCYLPT